MARKVKTEQDKKKSTVKKVIIVIIILALVGVGVFFGVKYLFKKEPEKARVEIKELDNLKEYGYVLTDKDTEYFKTEFGLLKEVLNEETIDKEKYATQVARLFIIDLYTMSTKINQYDVGGSEYFYKTYKDMYDQKVIDELYSSMLDNTYGDRTQVLPEVNEIETISTEEITYSIRGEDNSCYLFKFNIKYVTDLKYDNKASVVVCDEDEKRMSVVDYQPTFTPKYGE